MDRRQKLRKKISKNIVSYELPHMTKTIDEIMTYIDDYVNEQLALCNVSNRRELLEAFTEKCNKYRTTMEEITPEEIDKFLDSL